MKKCTKGTIGKPIFKHDDVVGFYLKFKDKEIFCKGKIYVIDRYGTFEQNKEPSYDIMVENFDNSGEPCLVKHIVESKLYRLNGEENMERKVKQFIYPGKVKIISLPKRQLSPNSEYPELIGLEGKIASISGNSVGVIIDGKYNKHSKFGWYWFDVECIEKV